MKNLLLSVALIALPVGAFALVYPLVTAPPAATASAQAALGDMSPFQAIVSDTRDIAATGDLAGAEARITDLETAWDKAEPDLRPVDTAAWGNVDSATDAAIGALRARSPDPAKVKATLTQLSSVLSDPAQDGGASGGVAKTVAGIAVTDGNGHPLPCEVMLATLKDKRAGATLSDADAKKLDDFQAKGTERCNADDDSRADAFLAQGIAIAANPS